MQSYLELLAHVANNGHLSDNRTGIRTYKSFGHSLRFDLQAGFPLLTTKKIHFKSVAHELLWFIAGNSNIKYLNDNGVRIWDEWANAEGELGPVYGSQWRSWQGADGGSYDQLAQLVANIKRDPQSRRHIVSAWNVGELAAMALAPCHVLFQVYVQGDKLSLALYQRSADIFLGLPFNIASYSLLTMMLAQVSGLRAGEFVHFLGDTHLYENHLEQAQIQLQRQPRPLPRLYLNPERRDLFAFRYEDIELLYYDPHPAIKAEVAI